MQDHARRVLLAEDDRFLRKAAGAMLRRQGFTVLTAEDGEEALRIAGAENPNLILLDLIMPKLQGFEVLKALKSNPQTAPIPVVILSNLGQESDSEAARELGAFDYWVKANLDLEEIVRRIEDKLGADNIEGKK